MTGGERKKRSLDLRPWTLAVLRLRSTNAVELRSAIAGLRSMIGTKAPRVSQRFAPHDAELFHAEPQGVRMKSEPFGCVADAVDAPAAILQHFFDVRALHGHERRPHLRLHL